MAYTKKEWNSKDEISHDRLNDIENALEEYSKQTDENTDLIDSLMGVAINYGDGSSGHGAITANGGTLEFSGSLALLFCAYSANSTLGVSITMFRSGYPMPMIPDSNISVEANGTSYKITNNNTTALRYFLFVVN